jgi:GNAT superfamily N-acetyltransferase
VAAHRNGHTSTTNGHARNGAASHATPPEPAIEVRVSTSRDVVHVARIQALLEVAHQSGAIVAGRSAEYVAAALKEKRAVVVVRGELLVGFATAHAWQSEQYVSHSAMVVAPEFRGRGLARRMKALLIETSRRRWPNAAILSLTLSTQVERLNKSFGFEPVPYCDLTTDPEFWAGCEGCMHHAHLKRNQQQDCHCWSGLLLPAGRARDRIVPRDAYGHPSASPST